MSNGFELTAASRKPGAPRTPLLFLGLACAVGVSTIYYNQPLLLEMGHSYGVTAGRAGFVAVATQVGYAIGLLCFVPLGDVLERRALMMRMYAAVAVALLAIAMAPNFAWLIVASAAAGMLAAVTHIVLPIAPDLATHEGRGRAIGIVMTGLLLGILLARTFSGWVSKLHGWRLVFVAAAVMNAVFVPLLWRLMPKLPPKQALRYREAMQSLWTLWRTEPLLRESSTIGALILASFSCFWTTLAFLLDSHYGLGPGVAGTFGLVGAAGALVAPLAGRLSDKHGPRYVVQAGILLPVPVGWRACGHVDGAASCCHVRRRHCPGPRCADDAGRQPDADLRSRALGPEPSEYGLYDELLCRWSHRVRARNRGLGTLEMGRRLHPGAYLCRLGGSTAFDGKPEPAGDQRG